MDRRWLVISVLGLVACDRIPGLGKKQEESGGAQASATSASSAAVPAARGPTVTVAAGTLKAGTACGVTPRVSTEELVGESIAMTEFTIDVLPYPNDPARPIRVDVSRDEAQALCAADGKRLCTELEWERACKGPSNTMFEYGPGYNATHCKVATDLLADKRPKCVSGFGVKDMHGLAYEWTSSAWGRGTSGDLATVRGGGGPGAVLQARCQNGQGRAASTRAKDVGFRCCSGPQNPPEVNLTLQKQPPMVAEPSVEANLAAAMLKAMPADHRTIASVEVVFDKVWRWHPRDNEELLIARWTGKPRRPQSPWHEIAVFKVCGGVPGLVARMKGPVDRMGEPGAGSDPQKASVSVGIGADTGDVKLAYWYGSVQLEQPAWIKAGNALEAERKLPTLRLPARPRR